MNPSSLISQSWKCLANRCLPRPILLPSSYQCCSFSTRPVLAFGQSSICQAKKKKASPPVPPLDEADLLESFVRGSGPGGQAVNKTNNAVSLIHVPTGIRVQAHTHRSREANRNQARRRLAEKVDYEINKGHSQIEKVWAQERSKKRARARRQRRKEQREIEQRQRIKQDETVRLEPKMDESFNSRAALLDPPAN